MNCICGVSEWIRVSKTTRFYSIFGWLIARPAGWVCVCGACGREARIRGDGVRYTDGRAAASAVSAKNGDQPEDDPPELPPRSEISDTKGKWNRRSR